MANKKVVATIAAVATSAALLMGGTMAWQSINQTALNEASEVVNPGGRLHDDFNGTNKDIYVENFADEPIFARIRLDEHFEFMVDGTEKYVITKQLDENGEPSGDTVRGETKTFVTHQFDNDPANATDPYWALHTGGSTVYLPTFNMNKDSLTADINGTIQGTDGTNPWDDGNWSDVYDDYVPYSEDQKITDTEVRDADFNDIEEPVTIDADGKPIPVYDENGKPNIKIDEKEHTVTNTLHAKFDSLENWMAMVEADGGYDPVKHGCYWVYDADGWVYWTAPIAPHTATGLLLDGIQKKQSFDDGWYYAINAVAQFVTADDLGNGNGTGFYDTEAGLPPTAEALKLLKIIGVDTGSVAQDMTTGNITAEGLQAAFDVGGDSNGNIALTGTVTSKEIVYTQASDATRTANFLWTEGGSLSGGTIETSDGYFGTFINNENGWPMEDDGAKAVIVNNTTFVGHNSNAAVYTQAIDAPITLSNVTVTSDRVGIWDEYEYAELTLNGCTVTSLNNAPEGSPWLNSAVAVASNGNIVINNGYYEGNYAAYVFSSGGSITINNGTFIGDIQSDNGGTIIINNGTFSGKLGTGSNGNIVITGGTFSVDPTAYVNATAYDVIPDKVENPTTWTVQAKTPVQP